MRKLINGLIQSLNKIHAAFKMECAPWRVYTTFKKGHVVGTSQGQMEAVLHQAQADDVVWYCSIDKMATM